MTELPAELRRKRLIYRSQHRGTKEADVLLGRFAGRFGMTLSDFDVAWFEALLDEPDLDLLDWILRRSLIPKHHDHSLMERIQRFNYVDLAC